MRKGNLTIRAIGLAFLVFLVALPHSVSADEAQEAFRQGNAAFLRGDFDLAVRDYTDAIRLNPKDAVTYNNRGYAYLEKGESDKAIADYNEAIRLDPKYAKAYFFRGSEYEDTGDQDRAITDYTAAVRFDPSFARAYCSRGATAREPAAFTAVPAETSQAGANFFVAKDGDDRNPGTIERPFATLYKAHQWVRPGETINLRTGTYQALINWNKSGTPTAPITIQAYNGENVTLQCSEQYTWTHVNDPIVGDCWKVAIPFLPIHYPGVQHTVWEDAVNAAANPGIQIRAIIKGGYMCAAMHSAADFAHPETAGGRLTNDSGKLTYDVTWYDRSNKMLWFKSGPSHVTDPSRQLYVTSPASGQFSLAGSYVRLNGLKFEYLYFLHQQDNPTGCEISNCEIKHANQGFCGGGKHCVYSSLFIDKTGDWLTWRNGGYGGAYLAHCFYFNGSRCFISNCFFGRSNQGGPIQNYPEGIAENVFDGNILYDSDGGSIFMGSGKNYITNNISLQKEFGLSAYVSMQGFTFANNYSEAAYPFNFACKSASGAYTGTFEKFAITGNVFNNTGGWVDYRGNIVDGKTSRIDRNVYLGKTRWLMGLTQSHPPLTGYRDCTSYASYTDAIQALPSCAAWEKNSQQGPALPRFDFASFDGFLDSDPPLAAALLRIRRYVKNVTAPFPGAGPILPELSAGGRG